MRRLLWRSLSSFSRDLSHFQLLEVGRDADLRAIKLAFYRKAKVLHPDVCKDLSLEQANTEFVRLKAAYDVLSDETLRLQYLRELDNPARQRHATDTERHHYHYNDDDLDWSASRTRAQQRAYRRKSRSGTPSNLVPFLASSWQKFQVDLEAALAKAYYGPLFTPDADCECGTMNIRTN